jgi:hypothetical protein
MFLGSQTSFVSNISKHYEIIKVMIKSEALSFETDMEWVIPDTANKHFWEKVAATSDFVSMKSPCVCEDLSWVSLEFPLEEK